MKNSICEFCNKDFVAAWRLRRHINSKNGCIERRKMPEEGRKMPLCSYCGKGYVRLGKHEKICKKKEDEIWNFETELGIEHKVPHKENECEYCRKVQSIGNMKRHKESCEHRKDYLEILITMMNLKRGRTKKDQIIMKEIKKLIH